MKLATGVGKRQVAEFIEHDEVLAASDNRPNALSAQTDLMPQAC
jgi:hypothetical protein